MLQDLDAFHITEKQSSYSMRTRNALKLTFILIVKIVPVLAKIEV